MQRSGYLALLLGLWGLASCGVESVSEESSAKSAASGGCYRQSLPEYEALFREAFTALLGDSDLSVYINCLSFSRDKGLEAAIVSGNGSSTERVLRFSCTAGETLLAVESDREFSSERNESCLECASPSATAEDACPIPCASGCDRCYEMSDSCDCSTWVYDVETVINAVEALTEEELGEHEEHLEEAFEETIERLSHCASECPEHFETNKDGHGNPNICYACGVQFCTKCKEEEGKRECTKCLPHTELGEGECLFGLELEILHVAEEQEKEVEKEEEKKAQTRLELAVTLPIVSVAVVVFFIFMSFIAHKRYPHIGETGKTRHRNKPTSSLDEEDIIDDSVFRPRPTIRLR